MRIIIKTEMIYISFFTSDGFTETEDKELMQKLNEKHIRIFSYAVGPHPLPVTALNKMACDTNGSYTHIATTGAIRTQIQVHLKMATKWT